MPKIKVNLTGIEKTMILPLFGRAMQSKRKDSNFIDKKAEEIFESIDIDVEKLKKGFDDIKHNKSKGLFSIAAGVLMYFEKKSN